MVKGQGLWLLLAASRNKDRLLSHTVMEARCLSGEDAYQCPFQTTANRLIEGDLPVKAIFN